MPEMTIGYETKQSTPSFEDYTDNHVFYNVAKEQLLEAIHDDKEIIILVGSGGNGKSHLTNEMDTYLSLNNYSVSHERFSMCNSAESFNRELESTTGKILIHLLFNPFQRWNIQAPPNTRLISMEHIHF